MFDCIIIGATLPGMTLGALLAKSGWKVCLLEKRQIPGGKKAPWQREGYLSLQGLPRVRYGVKGPFYKICKLLEIEPQLVSFNQGWVLDANDKVKRITIGNSDILLADFISTWDRFAAWKILHSLRKEQLEDLEEESLEEWFVKNNIRSSLQDYFKLLAYEATHCTVVEKISAGETLRCFQKAFKLRSYLAYPSRGWLPILESMQKEIQINGEIRWYNKVQHLEINDNRVSGVHLEDQFIKADCVVCATSSHRLAKLLPDGATTREYLQLCKKAQPSAALIVDFALNQRIFSKKGLWFFLDPPAYGTFLSNFYHRHAPAGKQLLTFVCPISRAEAKNPQGMQMMEKKIEENLRKAFPPIETAVEWKRSHVVRMLDSIAITADQTRKDRPGYRVPNVNGLFLVGDSTCAPGATMELEYESVLACYQRITEEREG